MVGWGRKGRVHSDGGGSGRSDKEGMWRGGNARSGWGSVSGGERGGRRRVHAERQEEGNKEDRIKGEKEEEEK